MTYAKFRADLKTWIRDKTSEYFTNLLSETRGNVLRASIRAEMDRSNFIRAAKKCGAYFTYFNGGRAPNGKKDSS